MIANILTAFGIMSMFAVPMISWMVGITSDLRVQERANEDLITLINSRFDSVNYRLERIEKSLNGNLKH